MRYEEAFQPIRSSHTSFDMILSTASSAVALESSGRIWSGPTGRAVRLAESSGVEYRVAFGSSTVVVDAATHPMLLGGTVELFSVSAGNTYVAIMTTSTAVSNVSISLGYGR